MSDIFIKDEYVITKNGNRGIISIKNENSFKTRDITIMVEFLNDFIVFNSAFELNNKTMLTYRTLSDFQTMHNGLYEDIVDKYKKGLCKYEQ